MSDIKKEIEQAAIAKIKCPSCDAAPTQKCRNMVADERGKHRHVSTHQRRLSAFVMSAHVSWK